MGSAAGGHYGHSLLSVPLVDCNVALQSLSGHQSPVECVSFDSAEEVVVAGATGGTVKLWDLEQAKGVQALWLRFTK